jgi:hypothetical protein
VVGIPQNQLFLVSINHDNCNIGLARASISINNDFGHLIIVEIIQEEILIVLNVFCYGKRDTGILIQ